MWFESLAIGTLVALQAPQDAADIRELAWLEGCWAGEALGGEVSECWVKAANGRLTGMFQLVLDGNQSFSELFVLDDFGDGPELRLKHFSAEFDGWEARSEHVTFRLLAASARHAEFEGMRFVCTENQLIVIVLQVSPDGRRQDIRFEYQRTTPAITECA